jgi:hypothetical protein
MSYQAFDLNQLLRSQDLLTRFLPAHCLARLKNPVTLRAQQGDAHPLKAIGIVATILVFGSAMLVKEGWAFLSVLERS